MNTIKKLIDATMKGRTASNSKKIIINSKMRHKIIQIGQKTEDYLDSNQHTFLIDLMVLHGHNKETKSFIPEFICFSRIESIA
jgi:hypothetical protein